MHFLFILSVLYTLRAYIFYNHLVSTSLTLFVTSRKAGQHVLLVQEGGEGSRWHLAFWKLQFMWNLFKTVEPQIFVKNLKNVQEFENFWKIWKILEDLKIFGKFENFWKIWKFLENFWKI